MLKIKTTLKTSPINGIGLFADEDIAEGTIVWEFDAIDSKYTQGQYDTFTEIEKEFLNKYSYKFEGEYILCVDNARFFNHSDSPNCGSFDYSSGTLGNTQAIRNIKAGEELTDDYNYFGLTQEDKDWNVL